MTDNDTTTADATAAEMLAAHQRRMEGYTPINLNPVPCDRSRNRQRDTTRRYKRRPI